MGTTQHNEIRGLWLGLLGVVIFAMTLPMTRLAVGPAGDPQLPPLFVTAGRAAVAGLLSLIYLYATGAPRPRRAQLTDLAICASGTVVGFPLFLALALRHVDAMHAAVITGVLPLTTAFAAALSFRQRPSNGFWVCAVLGCALALVGTVRVSQVRLVQPFLALLFAVPVLGESLQASTIVFSLAVIATVFVGKRMPTDRVVATAR